MNTNFWNSLSENTNNHSPPSRYGKSVSIDNNNNNREYSITFDNQSLSSLIQQIDEKDLIFLRLLRLSYAEKQNHTVRTGGPYSYLPGKILCLFCVSIFIFVRFNF
jgi:hypothetical protein